MLAKAVLSGPVRKAIVATGGNSLVASASIHLGPRNGVRILNYHGTPTRSDVTFRSQVKWLSERYTLLSPNELFGILDGVKLAPSGRSLVFTFDDGLRSNYEVAAPILEEFGVRGLFFINPGFVETSEPEKFFVTRIRRGFRCASREDYSPMRERDLRDLQIRGHVVGNHTFHHADLRSASVQEAVEEIENGKLAIEAMGVNPCRSFAWTFGWQYISRSAFQYAIGNHDFCFTPCPGWNDWGKTDPKMLFRANVESKIGRAHV